MTINELINILERFDLSTEVRMATGLDDTNVWVPEHFIYRPTEKQLVIV